MSTTQRLALRLAVIALAVVAVTSAVIAEEEPTVPPAEPPVAEPKPAEPPPPLIGTREGTAGREQMWFAPTAEDWAKPCLLTWQRTWDDAVAVARETGKPILICINMDGEIASEHYAGIRYRQPEVAELYSQYVCVIASVYRHNPRDYDDEGNRIPCPRFGGVTCGEHIWIEPVIYEKFCDGERVSPRHIAVDINDNEAYDVYYTDDTASVFDAVREGRAKFPEAGPPIVRGDRPIIERVASRDVRDRTAVEKAYLGGSADARRALLEAALQHGDAAQLDLLRLAVFGLDVDLSRKARAALAKVEDPNATKLISEALRVPMDTGERDALIAALERLGESSTLARWLAGVHQGLGGSSSTVDVKRWSEGGRGATYPAVVPRRGAEDLTTIVEARGRRAAESPEDPVARVELAEATLAAARELPQIYGENPRLTRMVSRQLYRDTRRTALEAEALGAMPWRVNSVLALAAYYSDDLEEAYERAAMAMAELPPGEPSWNSMAVVTVFAESRWKAIKAAVAKKERWPSQLLSDLHAAYAVLQQHPLGTDDQVVWHYEFLVWLGAEFRASRVLRQGITRFQGSLALHKRLRDRLLKHRGAKALEDAYDEMVKENETAQLVAYAGVASVVVAENYRRTRKYDKAMDAYERAIQRYERAIELEARTKDVADHVIALVRAGRARVAYERGDDEVALVEILASFARRPDAAGSRDAMGITPGETAQMLLARLRKNDREDLAGALEEALGKLDSELLRPDRGLLGDTPPR